MAKNYSEHESIDSDFTEIRDVIARDNPEAALVVIDAIYKTLAAISETPERFPSCAPIAFRNPKLRQAIALPYRNYHIFFELGLKEIRVLYIHHPTRDFETRHQKEKRL